MDNKQQIMQIIIKIPYNLVNQTEQMNNTQNQEVVNQNPTQSKPIETLGDIPSSINVQQNTNKFCQNCGNKLTDGDIFCPNCGTKVN